MEQNGTFWDNPKYFFVWTGCVGSSLCQDHNEQSKKMASLDFPSKRPCRTELSSDWPKMFGLCKPDWLRLRCHCAIFILLFN